MSGMDGAIEKKVCMLGSFAVGKTSLVRRVVEGRFAERYLTTVGVRVERLDVRSGERPVRMLLWDIAGDDDFATVRASYLRGAAGYVLVVDAERPSTLETAMALHERVRRVAGEVPFMLLVNKSDLPIRRVEEESLAGLARRGWRIHEVSARTGDGVTEAFTGLAGALLGRPRPSMAPIGTGGDGDVGRDDGDDGEVALDLLTSLGAMVLAREVDGGFRVIGRPPPWAAAQYPETAHGRRLHPERRFTFLSSFLDDAQALWATGDATARLDSGPFREGDGGAMEATAVRVAGRALLLLRRLGAEHDAQVAVLQRSRDNLLEQDRLEVEVLRRTRDIRRREEEIALRLVSAAESRDGDTGAHVRRIGLFSAAIARALGWGEPMIEDLRLAAPMHDIGKIGIPDSILLEPGPLTADQWAILRTHTITGAALLESSDVPLLQMAHQIALHHHEWWDGGGYPSGLAGLDIPEAARIVAVADVYDALVHRRPYKPALSEREALEEMTAERGTHFDPDVFDAFVRELPRIRELRRSVGDRVLAGTLSS